MLLFVTTWMNPTKSNKSEKDKFSMFSLICRTLKKQTRKPKFIGREDRLVVVGGGW